MKKRIVIVSFLALALLGYISFRAYRNHKTRVIVSETLSGKYHTKKMIEFYNEHAEKGQVIFLGNSLMDYFPVNWFEPVHIINRGICGDFTAGVLKRLDGIIALLPSKIFIEIGINDIIEKVPPDEIQENYKLIIKRLKEKLPHTKIFVISNLPVSKKGNLFSSTEEKNEIVIEQNIFLEELCLKNNLTFVNLHPLFYKNGMLNPAYTWDGIHITSEGYQVWFEVVKKLILN